MFWGAGHERPHQIYLGVLHSRPRTQLHLAHFHRRNARNAPQAAVERLYVLPLTSRRALGAKWDMIPDRLENEHLGNMDQYRVTREVPLPYTFDDQTRETDGDEDDRKSVSSWRSRRKGPKTKTPPSGLKGDASAAEVHEDI